MTIAKKLVPSLLTGLLIGYMPSTGASSAEFRVIPPSVDSAKRSLVTVEGIIERGVIAEYIPLGEPLPELPKCWSACTLLFASGVVHTPTDNVDARSEGNIIRIPTIGVHRPAFVGDMFGRLPPREAQHAYTRMLDDMAEFLLSMGATEEFVRLSMSTPASQIELIPNDKMSEFVAVPFYEEWLSARCPVDYSSFTEEELRVRDRIYEINYEYYSELQSWDHYTPEPRSVDVRLVEEFGLEGTIEAGAIKARADSAYRATKLCRFVAVHKTRQDWAESKSSAIAHQDETERSRSDEK